MGSIGTFGLAGYTKYIKTSGFTHEDHTCPPPRTLSSFHECQGGDTTGEAARVLIEDVHDAIFDLVELIKTFQSKNKLSKLFLSTLFKRRQEELDAVVDRAIMRLQVSELNVFLLFLRLHCDLALL